jgi:hypothetical protein
VRFDLVLPSGPHTLVATTERGEARQELTFDLPERRWAVLDYWHEEGGPKELSWQLLDHEPAFG